MLTMRIAEDALSEFQTETQIMNGTSRLDGIRFGVMPSNSNYLAVSPDGTDVLLTHDADNIRVLNAGINDVSNAVLDFTEHLILWETDLYTLINEGAPLQSLIDHSLDFFRNPIFIIDETNTVQARSSHDLGTVSDDWDHIIMHGSMPIDLVREIYKTKPFLSLSPSSQSHPFIYGPPGMAHRGINYRIPSTDKSTFIGTLIVIENETPITMGMLQYSLILADAVVRWVHRHSGERIMYSVSDMLLDLLGSIKLSEGRLVSLESVISAENHTYRIACAVSQETMRVSQYHHLVDKQLSHSICCEYGDTLVTLFADSAVSENIKTFEALFGNVPVSVGMSNAFTDLNFCGSCLRQAQIAAKCGHRKVSELNAESVMKFIAAETRSGLLGTDLIHPALRRLSNYDNKHGTQMFETLSVFLKNERSLVKSLQVLNVHRNSLIYRLERIAQITECDFDDSDDREWLLFSFRIADNATPF